MIDINWLVEMACKTETDIQTTVVGPANNGPALGTAHQIYGGSGMTSIEETRKRLNARIDFIPEYGYRGQNFKGKELIPLLPNDIVAEGVWLRICEGNDNEQVQNMLNMRLVSKFWCAFMDSTEFMDQVQMDKYNRVGPHNFRYAPTRFMVFARYLD